MKRYIIFLIILTISLAPIYTYADKSIDNLEKIVTDFTEDISKEESFKVWVGEQVEISKELFNTDGNLTAYLVYIKHNNDIIGYMIINSSTYEIEEFALGQSPYDDYLEKYIAVKESIFENKDAMLIYAGPTMYGILVDSENNTDKKIYDFTKDPEIRISVNAMEDVEQLINSKGLNREMNKNVDQDMINSTVVEKVLSVPDYQWYRGCGPTTGCNLVYYWDGKGYPNLVVSPQTYKTVIDELHSKMLTIPPYEATLAANFSAGLISYFDDRYSYEFDIDFADTAYYTITDEIYSNRPGAILYIDHPNFGEHYVTFVGYRYNADYPGSEYYVIHDTWSDTPTNVYRKWSTDEPYISATYSVIP